MRCAAASGGDDLRVVSQQNLTTLAQQPGLQDAGVGIINGKIFLDQLLVELLALDVFQSNAKRHLSAFDVGAEDLYIHRPVERAESLRVVTRLAGHRARNTRRLEIFSKPMIAFLSSSRT